jgi:hypothetical protein
MYAQMIAWLLRPKSLLIVAVSLVVVAGGVWIGIQNYRIDDLQADLKFTDARFRAVNNQLTFALNNLDQIREWEKKIKQINDKTNQNTIAISDLRFTGEVQDDSKSVLFYNSLVDDFNGLLQGTDNPGGKVLPGSTKAVVTETK